MTGEPVPMSASILEHTTDFDYMASERAAHASHGAVENWLAETYQDARFSLLDCGVLSAVT